MKNTAFLSLPLLAAVSLLAGCAGNDSDALDGTYRLVFSFKDVMGEEELEFYEGYVDDYLDFTLDYTFDGDDCTFSMTNIQFEPRETECILDRERNVIQLMPMEGDPEYGSGEPLEEFAYTHSGDTLMLILNEEQMEDLDEPVGPEFVFDKVKG